MFSDKTDIKTDKTDKTDIKTDKTDIENPKVKLQIQGLLQLQKEVIVIIQYDLWNRKLGSMIVWEFEIYQ